MKKDEKPDTLAVINNYNFCDNHTHIHTDRQTWQLYDRPGPEGQVGENPNIGISVLNSLPPHSFSGQ